MNIRPSPLLLLLLTAASATLLGALAFEHIGGLAPCPLCLQQRYPYWLGIPIALVALLALARGYPGAATALALLVGAGFAAGSVLAFYHAGIEWHWWRGPTTCAGGALPSDVTALLSDLQGDAPPRCDEAAWRLLGISLSGYNALISAALAALSLRIATQTWRLHARKGNSNP